MSRVLVINGSYRHDGVTDQILDALMDELRDLGAEVSCIRLREYPIEFCLNCRECTLEPGNDPGQCVQNDEMRELIRMIEKADAFVLASPTNFGSVTALFKRFMERLIVYGYWPWGKASPAFRKRGRPKKRALVVTSSAAPGFLGRWFFSTTRQLKTTADLIGAKTVGTIVAGLMAAEPVSVPRSAVIAKVRRYASRLV